MDDLFNSALERGDSPLADRMRPRFLDDIIGQDHIVGEGRLLRRSIQADRLSSVIFYGPPGTGKTSLARVIANTTKSSFESLNAVLTGVKDIREAIDRATERKKLYSKRTILFVDEVHRWNKAQQDALLPWVESGTIILIGATTENPFFEVNRALVSRSRIFQLKSLTTEDLIKAAHNALNDTERGYGNWKITFEDNALYHLVEVSSGDARSLLNALELVVETTPPSWPPPYGSEIFVTVNAAEQSIQKRAVLYDRDGDYHFDTISAFIKSIRGSDPDAALYWLAKMVRSGEDPAFIFRRMIILASEDVGMADPHALSVVISCAASFDRIGFPEGNYPLAHACIYLATAPKSNSAMAFFDALAQVDKEDAEIPNHLKDASRDKESFGHGEGYNYPHTYKEHWVAQQYLPSTLQGKLFYIPSAIGYEKKIHDEVIQKRELQAASLLQESGDNDFLTWTPFSKGRESWYKRVITNRSQLLTADRDAIFNATKIERHSRILIGAAGDGLLLWEALRRTPEGLCCALVRGNAEKQTLSEFGRTASFNEEELPEIEIENSANILQTDDQNASFSSAVFDFIIAREPFRHLNVELKVQDVIKKCAVTSKSILAPNGKLIFLASPPCLGQRLSQIIQSEYDVKKFAEAENNFFENEQNKTSNNLWDKDTLECAFTDEGFVVDTKELSRSEQRLLSEKEIMRWFDAEKSSWGKYIFTALGESEFNNIQEVLKAKIKQGPLLWSWKSLLLIAHS